MQAPTEFINLMDVAAKNYRQRVNKETVEWYWQYLRGISMPNIKQAFDDCFESEEFFPSIATIRKHLPQAVQTRDTYDAPDFKALARQGRSQIAKDSLKIIFAKMDGAMTREEYYQAMLDLESKYPGIEPVSFREAAELYKVRKRLA